MPDHGPLSGLSTPARTLIVICILGAFAGTLISVAIATESFPAGRYPIFLFALPPIVVAAVICGIGLKVMKGMGVPIYAEDLDDKCIQDDENAAPPDGGPEGAG
jgi:hypothetical protein